MIRRPLFESSLVRLAEFIHPRYDNTWVGPQVIQSKVPLVVFPRTSVEIRFPDKTPFMTTANHAMFYNPGTVYSRHPVGPMGDEYIEFQLGNLVIQALEAETGRVRAGRLIGHYVATPGSVYLHQHLLAQHLKDGGFEPLLVEETALHIMHALLAPAGNSRPHRATTRAQHRELAEEAKRLLTVNLGLRVSLAEIAHELTCSPFHLERLFRRETGFTLHAYRTQLRLRAALERLPTTECSLATLAFELGFASHSHFTAAFRRAFGVPPSAISDRDRRRRYLEARELALSSA